MVNFDKPVGTAGTMRIEDYGTGVAFWILCSDGATNVGSYVWSGVVNGSPVGGSVNLPAGFGSRNLGAWPVSTSQTVSFHQNATGTSGLGGAADHSAFINRTPAATAPPKPTMDVGSPNPDQITPTSMRVRYLDQGDGGSTITTRALQVAQTPDFSGSTAMIPVDQSGIYQAIGLTPGYPFYWRYRVQNAIGVSPWSDPVLAWTTGTVQVSDGTTFVRYAVDVSDGTTWVRQIVDVSDGTNWRASS